MNSTNETIDALGRQFEYAKERDAEDLKWMQEDVRRLAETARRINGREDFRWIGDVIALAGRIAKRASALEDRQDMMMALAGILDHANQE